MSIQPSSSGRTLFEVALMSRLRIDDCMPRTAETADESPICNLVNFDQSSSPNKLRIEMGDRCPRENVPLNRVK